LYASRRFLIGAFSGGFFMPEIVTGFRSPEKPHKQLITKDQSSSTPAFLPTKFPEEPKK
jgi:hypothetical protein